MNATSPSAPSLPRTITQAEVAHVLATFMVNDEGIVRRGPGIDWHEADLMILQRWGARGLKHVKRLTWRTAAERAGLLS